MKFRVSVYEFMGVFVAQSEYYPTNTPPEQSKIPSYKFRFSYESNWGWDNDTSLEVKSKATTEGKRRNIPHIAGLY